MNSLNKGRKKLNIKIYYFSATGNTKYGSNCFSIILLPRGITVNCIGGKRRQLSVMTVICWVLPLPVYGAIRQKS